MSMGVTVFASRECRRRASYVYLKHSTFLSGRRTFVDFSRRARDSGLICGGPNCLASNAGQTSRGLEYLTSVDTGQWLDAIRCT